MAEPVTLPPSLDALLTRLGLTTSDLDSVETARASAILDDAVALALAEVPASVATRWQADAPAVVVTVILKAARREFENPRGLTNESVGDRSVGLSDSSGVYFTAREIALLRRAATGRSGGFVGTVRIASGYGEVDGTPADYPFPYARPLGGGDPR